MKKLTIVAAVVISSIAVVYGVNYIQLQDVMNSVIEKDSRNQGIDVSVRYGSYLNLSVLVYELRDITGTNSRADVFRVFLQFADAVQEKEFETVQLAFRGDTRFIMDGSYFNKLGREYSFQNPVYTMRTLPEELSHPNGDRAYYSFSDGGLLGGLTSELDNFNDFHDKWYLDDLLTEQ